VNQVSNETIQTDRRSFKHKNEDHKSFSKNTNRLFFAPTELLNGMNEIFMGFFECMLMKVCGEIIFFDVNDEA